MDFEESKPTTKTVFYDPMEDRSKKTFDHIVFENPWDAPAPPVVEKNTKTIESENDHDN